MRAAPGVGRAWALFSEGPSDLFKGSFKLALSLTLAIGISLAMDWPKAYWAGLAVIVCSLSTNGDSLNKGMMRLKGTAIGIVVALVLVAAFAQHRWLYMLFLSLHVGFCAYMAGVSSRSYIWVVAGVSVPLLSLPGGADSVQTFQLFLLRLQETGLGVVTFTLVGILLWPETARAPFERALHQGLTDMRRLIDCFFAAMTDHSGDLAELDETGASIKGVVAQLPAMLRGAELDSLEIYDRRHTWEQIVQGLVAVVAAGQRWRYCLADIQRLGIAALLPNLADFRSGLGLRFARVESLIAGSAEGSMPKPVVLQVDMQRVNTLSHFERAALLSCVEQMQNTARQLDAVMMAAERLRSEDLVEPADSVENELPKSLDPDRLEGAIRVFGTVWIFALLWFYLPGLPLGSTIVIFGVSLGTSLTLMPGLSVLSLLRPMIQGLVVSSLIYFLVMPQLSGFLQLAPVIFVTAFLFCYCYPLPQGYLARIAGLILLILVGGYTNEQTYSFTHAANWFVLVPGVLLVLGIVSYFPASSDPNARLRRQLRRYFNSCAVITGRCHRPVKGWLGARVESFYLAELTSLPAKVAATAKTLPARALAGDSERSLTVTLAIVRALSTRLADLHTILQRPMNIPDQRLAAELSDWLAGLESRFKALASLSLSHDVQIDRSKLEDQVARIEGLVASTMDARDSDQPGDDDKALYRLLATLREVSQNYLSMLAAGDGVDWEQLWEERF